MSEEEIYNRFLLENELSRLLMIGAEEIRKKITSNERDFLILSRAYNGRGRKHYVYEVLNEIEQVVLILTNTQDVFSGPPLGKPKDFTEIRLRRNLSLVIKREQDLHVRRLTEILIDLINFSSTNQDPYFDHYLLYQELVQREKRSSDLKNYYKCENINNQYSIKMVKQSISWGEKNLLLNSCWYLRGKNPHPDGKADLATFRDLFNKALPLATKSEKFVLGFSYGEAYGSPSNSIHLNVGGIPTSSSFESLEARRTYKIMFLAFHCLLRCRCLLKMRYRKGDTKELVAGLKSSMDKFYKRYIKPDIRRGDFVIINNSLCEVIGVIKSAFGYRSFKVRYLSRAPIEYDKEDCFPAQEVKKFIDGNESRDSVIKLLTVEGQKPIISPRIIRRAMRKTVLQLWEEWTEALRKRRFAASDSD